MLRRLKEYHFELAFVLKDDLASAILAWRCRINQRRGFAREGASLFLTHAIDPKKTSRHGAARHFALAAMTAPKKPQTSFLVSADEAQEAKTLLGQTKTYIVFTPTTTRTEKDWPETACRDFIEKCTSLSPSTKPMTIVLLGVAGDSDRHQRIAAGTPVLNLTGKTSVGVMAALIQSATCLVACDSGPMHLAAALKRPLVALFGQTDPDHCGPASPFATIIRAETTCAPCHNRHCGANSACMASITAEKVYAAVAQILGGRDKV
jgi:lipopolysaccharide heptosyltransferase II